MWLDFVFEVNEAVWKGLSATSFPNCKFHDFYIKKKTVTNLYDLISKFNQRLLISHKDCAVFNSGLLFTIMNIISTHFFQYTAVEEYRCINSEKDRFSFKSSLSHAFFPDVISMSFTCHSCPCLLIIDFNRHLNFCKAAFHNVYC